MYECQIVEFEDMSIDHYMNHFDEYESNEYMYDDELDLDDEMMECNSYYEL